VTFHSSGKEGAISKAFSAEGQTVIARIRTAKVEVTVQDRQVRSRVQWDSVNAGQLTADVQTALQYEGKNYLGATVAPDAPLSGSVQAQMPDLGIWASFAPPGWRVAGSLAANVQLAGNLQDPRWSGTITADKMHVQSQLDGVDLRNGSLRAQLNGNTLELQSLHFDGGEGSRARIAGYSGNLTAAPTSGGTLDATGTISWTMPQNGAAPDIRMDIRTQAKALQVLVRADRQVSVSGQVRSQLQQGQMSITGDLTVDRASIMLADESSPKLGSDVVVSTKASRAAAAEKAKQEAAKAAQAKLDAPAGQVTPAKPLILNVKLDMGHDFALQGYGITTRLTGTLNVQSSGGAGIGVPRINPGPSTTHKKGPPPLGPGAECGNRPDPFQWPVQQPLARYSGAASEHRCAGGCAGQRLGTGAARAPVLQPRNARCGEDLLGGDGTRPSRRWRQQRTDAASSAGLAQRRLGREHHRQYCQGPGPGRNRLWRYRPRLRQPVPGQTHLAGPVCDLRSRPGRHPGRALHLL